MLIDFDNVTMGIRSDLQNQLRKLLNSDIFKGKVSVQRAYADWRRYPQYIVPLSEASIDLIFAPAFGSNKKNATDIRLAIDALELVFTRPEIGTFILLSGDSDFSSLVLKLKEYGKYIIGVGIRESSSDLLIQNCDEYYGYAEITGLTKEGHVEVARRDPWELVVEAVLKMREEDDVMRSDRLKQVMQGIDPNFDEKEAGYNRFSKFVQESGRRGLLTLTKLDNGQYAIDVGPDANVPPGTERAPRAGGPTTERTQRPRRRRERRPVTESEPLALAEAFELLKQALWVLGAVGDQAGDADEVRDKMAELYGDQDPVFDRVRFRRFLRQAHDADLIELIKSEDDRYLLKLSAQVARADISGETFEPATDVAPEGKPDDGATQSAQPTQRAKSSARKGTRSRTRSRSRKNDEESSNVPQGTAASSTKPASDVTDAESTTATGRGPKDETRNPRRRRGSKTPPSASTSPSPDAAPQPEPTPQPETRGRSSLEARSLGPRRGSRRGRPQRPATSPPAHAARPPVSRSSEPVSKNERTTPDQASGDSAPTADTRGRTVLDEAVQSIENEEEGLLRRMTSALHRMVGGTPPKRDG